MKKRTILFLMFLLTTKLIFAQSNNSRTLDYYFNIVDSLELKEMKNTGIITEKGSIAEKYLNSKSKGLNEKGFEKYSEIKANIYGIYYSNYLFLQSLDFKDYKYALYFSVAGFDDVEFQILKWNIQDWQNSDKLSKKLVEQTNEKFQKIAFNYDEGPKNLENVKIFIKNDYLVMERSGLYHSLFDLRNNELLINDESPWHSANANNLKDLNEWIKENIHSKIEQKINARQ